MELSKLIQPDPDTDSGAVDVAQIASGKGTVGKSSTVVFFSFSFFLLRKTCFFLIGSHNF